MRVLMVGDVVGRPGRAALAQLLPELRSSLHIDYVVVNGENAAAGRGLTEQTAREIFKAGADVISSGNHIFDVHEFAPSLDKDWPVLRPANYPPGTPGRGVARVNRLTVLNLMGRTFMPMPLDDPFRVVDTLLNEVEENSVIVVDFHAEATSEKQAFAWYLDGRVAAVVGTHTHVPTADARVLPRGTAAVTDLGMVGARDSIIGVDVSSVLQRFLTSMPVRMPVATGDEVNFNSVLIDVDDDTRRARTVERVDRQCLLR